MKPRLPKASKRSGPAELQCSAQKLADVFDASYWAKICPELHMGTGDMAAAPAVALKESRVTDLRDQMEHAGIAQVPSGLLQLSVNNRDLAVAVVQLLQHGWPPSFLMVFDELWCIIHQLSGVMKEVTGNACNMDVLAWYVDPNQGQRGFAPHRDRQPDDAAATFRADGSAMYATCWVPFTAATPDNSCLYVIPKYADPGYTAGDPEDDDAPDPLQAALSSKEAYQHIRALPAEPGSAVIFTHRIIHWGSQGREGYHKSPRISMSFACADDAYEPPYLSRQYLPFPPLELRVALAAAQMIIYHERFECSARQLSLFHDAFMAHATKFEPTYRNKVIKEFVAAMKDLSSRTKAMTGASVGIAPTPDTLGSRTPEPKLSNHPHQPEQLVETQHVSKCPQQSAATVQLHLTHANGKEAQLHPASEPCNKRKRTVSRDAPGLLAPHSEQPEQQVHEHVISPHAGMEHVPKHLPKIRTVVSPASALVVGQVLQQQQQQQPPGNHAAKRARGVSAQQATPAQCSSMQQSGLTTKQAHTTTTGHHDDHAGVADDDDGDDDHDDDDDDDDDDDLLELTLQGVLDAKMAGSDDVDDDYQELWGGSEGGAGANGNGGYDEEDEDEEQEEDVVYDEHGLALDPDDIDSSKQAPGIRTPDSISGSATQALQQQRATDHGSFTMVMQTNNVGEKLSKKKLRRLQKKLQAKEHQHSSAAASLSMKSSRLGSKA
eukprot:jgi/Chrzof1/4047/Cz13g18120.t1